MSTSHKPCQIDPDAPLPEPGEQVSRGCQFRGNGEKRFRRSPG